MDVVICKYKSLRALRTPTYAGDTSGLLDFVLRAFGTYAV